MKRRVYRWAARAKARAPEPLVRRALALRSLVGEGPQVGLPPSRRVLAVAPHPDDETLAFGGTVARLAARGADVHLVIASDGEASIGATGTPAETARRRREEARQAASLLGIASVEFVGLPDGRVGEDLAPLTAALRRHVDATPPDLVLTTWFGDGHPDHRAVARALDGVGLDEDVEVWGGEVWTPLPPNRLVPIDDVLDRKTAAAEVHATAAGAFDLTALLGLSRYRSVHGLAGQGHAEAFLAAPASEWIRLANRHGTPDEERR